MTSENKNPKLSDKKPDKKRQDAGHVYVGDLPAPAKNARVTFDYHKDAPRGFGVRVTPQGNRAFVLRYARDGRNRMVTIGQWPTWSLAAARSQATKYRTQIDNGQDIAEERRRRRVAPTVADVVGEYCKGRADRRVRGHEIRSTLERYFVHALRHTKIQEVRRRDVIELVEGVAEKHPRQAALLLGYIKQVFAWCEDQEFVEANPVATIKPQSINKRMTPKARARVLDYDEIRAFWLNVEDSGIHRLTALALKLVLVTGQRPGEVAGMRWSEINGETWTIPAERRRKTDSEHRVPLSETARGILDAAADEAKRLSRRRKARPGDLVFEARPGQSPESGALAKAVRRHVDAFGNRDAETWGHWTPHDLRRTMRTGLSACGVSELVAEILIGHTRKGIAATYDLHRFEPETRAAAEAWERRLLGIVGHENPAEIVHIHSGYRHA
ncbi:MULTISPECIES: site-specific integrase [unclassified Thioalkalivibrio]|uniref:tyrosine-type recombinase/integrase n=1 Tax=unclassified Thioalkalivibrio TaxID=2621013 RepID=UPI00036C7C2C|nr:MULTISPECIES: site-specific integrase [unclassified Thioalkalivibrio]